MGSPLVTLLFSLLLVLSIPLFAYSQCTYTSPNTSLSYDISNLDMTVSNNNGNGYWLHSQVGNAPNCSNSQSTAGPWYLNFCAAVTSSNNSTLPGCNSTVGTNDVTVCQFGKYSAGILEGATFKDLPFPVPNAPGYVTNTTQGFVINYFKGASASCGTKTRNTTVYLFCDPTTAGSFDCIYENKAIAACSYIIIFRSQYACASSGGFDGGWVFVIIVVCVIPLYLIIGALWKFRTGARGIELIPNVEFWRETPHYFKDGCRFLFYKLTCRKDDYTTF